MPTLTVRVLGRRADRASISVPLAPQDRGGKNAGTRAARNVSVNRADERCRAPQTRRAPRRPPTRSKPKSRAGLVRTTRDPAGKEQDICACLPKIRRSAAVRLRSILHALRWCHRREDLAVVRWNLHREKAALAAPYDIEGYGHAQRERLGGSAGCLFAHDAPHFAQWHVVLQTAFSRARFLVRKPRRPSCISAAIRATVVLPVPTSRAVRRVPVPASREARAAASRSADSLGHPPSSAHVHPGDAAGGALTGTRPVPHGRPVDHP